MKHLFATVGLLVAVAAAAGFVSFKLERESGIGDALEKRDALAWLRTDFQLSDAQFAAIRALHESYAAVCEEHCRAIQEATMGRNRLKAAPQADAAAVAAAEGQVEYLRRACENAIGVHVRQVAAEMSPDAGTRYLALVLPKIADFDHRAAPDLALTRHQH